jgi:type II secretory pathway pseudopilin PulG
MRRSTGQEGYTVPLVIVVIALILGFGGVTVTVATHNVDRAERDRQASRALQAADAGLDEAAYRMNKMILATKVESLLSPGTVEALLAEAGCLTVGAGDLLEANLTSDALCSPTASVAIDSEVGDDGLGHSARYRYWVKLRANVLVSGRSVIERQIISVGEVDGVVQRVSGIYRFDLGAPVGSAVTRSNYSVCTAREPEPGEDPAAGCPVV